MNLNDLLNKETLIVVVNKTVTDTSSKEEIKEATLAAWELNAKRASKVEYVIGIKHSIGVSCYKVDEIQIREEDGRVIFKGSEDLSDLVKGINFREMGVRTGYSPVEYIKDSK